LPYDTSEESAEVADSILGQLPAEDYPYLAEMIREHALKPGYDYAQEFEFGLDLILNGLERLREPASG
jgi:Tetracyclin repressor-like, C-terminal domain